MGDKQLRVLHLIDSLAIGGAERMAVNLSNVLASQGHDIHLCASRRGGPLHSFISPDVSYIPLGRKSVLDLGAILRLMQYVWRNRIRIVHAHSSSFFLAAAIKPLTGIKIVWHDHFGGREDLSYITHAILRIFSMMFSWSFAVNEHLLHWARRKLLIADDRISYLPNFPVLSAESSGCPELPGSKNSRMVCAARLNPQKDHLTLVRAMQEVKAEMPQAVLLLVGFDPDDDYARSVKTLIAGLNLAENVHLLGARTDVADILAESAIGVLSSKSEGLPVALLEYGLAGLPVVCTAVGECPAVLGYGAFGRVVSSGQPKALSTALVELLRAPDKQSELGRAFQAHVIENYSGTAICRQVAAIYRKVLGGH